MVVIFDMFETLVTHYHNHGPLYFSAQIAEDAGVPVETFRKSWRATEEMRSTGKVTTENVIENLLKEQHCYTEELLQKIAAKRIATAEECFRHLHPEVIQMLLRLKQNGISIGLISNCFSEEAAVIRRSPLVPYFEAVCLSYEMGVQKPDVIIYEKCMELLSVKSKECVYVGDGGSRELETARALGMDAVQAVWYLKEGSGQVSKRKDEFVQLERPLDFFEYLDL